MAIESLVDPMIGHTLGPYQVTGRIGAGGMGTVYRAIHQGLEQVRALKILPSHLAADRVLVERFSREARTAARLRHPNIVQIYDVGSADGVHFIAMELVAGRSLEELHRSEGRLPMERVFHLLRELALALDAAHASGVVHRDVKPSNAIVGPNDRLMLVDFGIARALGGTALTGSGVIGTPEYMAPELLRGEEGGPSVDQYALGVVAYELLTGQRPFRASTSPAAILYSQVNDAPPPPRQVRPELPKLVDKVLLRQLAKQPHGRYPTCVAFVEALTAAAAPLGWQRATVALPMNGTHGVDPARGRPAPGLGEAIRPPTLIPPAPTGRQTPPPPLRSARQTPPPPVAARPRHERTAGPAPGIGEASQPARHPSSRRRLPMLGVAGAVSVLVLLGIWFMLGSGQRATPITAQAPATVQAATATAMTASTPTAVAAGPTSSIASGTGDAAARAQATATPVATEAASPAPTPTAPASPAITLTGPVPPLREPRGAHAATLIRNGQLLVAGGHAGARNFLASAERFDPSSNTWSPAGRLAQARMDNTATLLSNGQVLVTGGRGEGGYLASVERYDPATDTWTTMASMAQARGDHTATLLPNGQVLVAGGWDGRDVLAMAELYDSTTNTWTPAGRLAKERHDYTATLLRNGQVLVVGGWDHDNPIGTAERYDPAGNTWTPAGSLETSRRDHAATLLEDGQVLVTGGHIDTNGKAVAPAERYDPVANAWTPAGRLTQPRGSHTATLLPNGQVLVTGGGDGTSYYNTDRYFATTELYDSATNSWAAASTMKWAHRSHSATLLPSGQVLVVGGYDDVDWPAPQWYDAAANAWIGQRSVAGDPITPANATQVDELQTLEGHSAAVKSVAFSPDGQTLVSGAGDKTVRLWRAGDGALLRTLEGHDGAVWIAAFSPDGQTVVSGSLDETVKLWRVSDGALLRTLEGHDGPVYGAAFSPDGQTVVTGSLDETVKLWRVSDGTLLRTLEGHEGAVSSTAFSPDGQTVASGSSDKTVKLWRVSDGTLLRTLQGHGIRVMSVAFSPDGQTLMSASGEANVPVDQRDNTVRLWRVDDGALLRTLTGHQSAVISAAFSPDGQTVVSGSQDKTLKLWRASDGALLLTLDRHGVSVLSVGFSPDGRKVASGSGGSGKGYEVKLWGVQ